MTELNPKTDTAALSAEVRAEIDRWLAKYPADQKNSAVLAALHAVQPNRAG